MLDMWQGVWNRIWGENRRTDSRKKLGRKGERLARNYLAKRGFRCLKRNYTTKGGEIDLIMRQAKTMVFVEVKTRRSEDFAAGEEAVNFRKQKHMIAAARYFLQVHDLFGRPCRFDVVVVVIPEKGRESIRHYENAFRYTY